MGKGAMVALILGIVGIVLGGGTLLVCLLLPMLTNGRTSWGEAMMGIIPGSLCFAFSLILAVIGLVMVIMKKKRAAQP